LHLQAVGVLAKSTTFAKNPRQLQFEADVNKLFMYTSYNRLGREAEETDAEEIIEMAGKATLSEQQKQVQENIHYQVEKFCSLMDGILLPDVRRNESGSQSTSPRPPRRSGLTFAIGSNNAFPHADQPRKCFTLLESICELITQYFSFSLISILTDSSSAQLFPRQSL
jgi:hypothetical protein